MRRITKYRRQTVRQRLVTWAADHLRGYPWRQPDTHPYNILVAELLLKRTTATAAARMYAPLLERYPTLNRLAMVSEDDLAHDLNPLGLSRQRARSIKKLSLALLESHGLIPTTFAELRSLPGLGDYAARAIMSFAHDVPVAVVDGNVERIFRRVFQRAIGAGASRATVQAVADMLLPRKRHRTFNFALLDLGALVCRPARPLCQSCPLQRLCDYANGPADSRAATRLRTTRTSRGISLSKLAALAGVSKLTIINIEAGRTRPRPQTTWKLACALGVSREDIADPASSR